MGETLTTPQLAEQYGFSIPNVVKAWAMVGGAVIAEATQRRLTGLQGGPLGAADGYPTTEGATLILPGDTWATLPSAPSEEQACRLVIADFGELVLITPDGFEVPAVLARPASYHRKELPNGHPTTEYVANHGLRSRASLVKSGKPDGLGGGCALDCHMCPLANSVSGYGGIKSIDNLLMTLNMAVKDERTHPGNHILISGGSPRRRDYEAFKAACLAIIRAHPDRQVDLMAVPLRDSYDPEELQDAGLHGMAINVEAHMGSQLAQQGLRSKAVLQGRGEYTRAWREAKAAGLLVRSLVLVEGAASAEDRELRYQLIEMGFGEGVSMHLSPLQPDEHAPNKSLRPPSVQELLAVAAKTKEFAAAAGQPDGYTTLDSASAHNTFPAPEEPRYTVPRTVSPDLTWRGSWTTLPAEHRPETVARLAADPETVFQD